jgi:gamma-glutamyltranspeptidase/glutathione hydrolase
MRSSLLVVLAVAAALTAATVGHAKADPQGYFKQPVAYGRGGGAASMSAYATAAAVKVLQQGGNAVDAAVAAAGVLGVTEPFVAGPGGGGFFLYYSARDHRVFTIDGREKAPAGATPTMFLGPDGQPLPFETAVESGLSVGVPGQIATWGTALEHWGTMPLARLLRPAERIARVGFPLDAPLVASIQSNATKLAHFNAGALYLPHGAVPPQGYLLRNPALARTYERIGAHGWRWFYTGPIARDIADTVEHPPVAPGAPAVAAGSMTPQDMSAYTSPLTDPVHWSYRGYTLWGMAPPTSGGTTIGETMNILQGFPMSGDRITALHDYIEASKLAYADRNQYVADPAFVNVPTTGLLSQAYANQRAALIGPMAAPTPVAPGDPWPFNGGGGGGGSMGSASVSTDQHTNHLVVADRWGNVVSYTHTIEQIAGSGMLVDGFLLNNELTDFNFVTGTANSVQPDKRPRSSMSPMIVTRDGQVVEAVGSPGGATIITTVMQVLLDQIDFGMSLPEAVEAPRVSQRNSEPSQAEPGFVALYGPQLQALGHSFTVTAPYIGIVAALAFLPNHRLEAVTESWRGGGGSAMVVRPENPTPKAGADPFGGA